jgi:hypothetical protein
MTDVTTHQLTYCGHFHPSYAASKSSLFAITIEYSSTFIHHSNAVKLSLPTIATESTLRSDIPGPGEPNNWTGTNELCLARQARQGRSF